jgi:DNA-binding XRE family transcriptional regulator
LSPDTVTRRASERGHPLAVARERAGLTQQQLADELGVNRVSIAKIETGARVPSMALARRIAAAVDESLETLFGGES